MGQFVCLVPCLHEATKRRPRDEVEKERYFIELRTILNPNFDS